MLVKTRTRAVYREGVLRPLKRLDLKEGEEVDIEIKSAVRRTQGIIKIDPEAAREIIESDDYSPLAE